VIAVRGIDQLDGDANLLARLAYTALEDRADVRPARDVTSFNILSFE